MGRRGQKGVDGLIIHDLITLAHRAAIADAVMISGDEDLLEAIESAQASGTRVQLLEIPIGGIARDLLRAVDRRQLLDETFWTTHLQQAMPTPAAAEESAATSALTVAELPSFEPPGGVTMTRPPYAPARRPAWLDEPMPSIDVETIGVEFAHTVLAESDGETIADLLAERPLLPTDLDRRLLRAADRWLSEPQRRALRDAFWITVEAGASADEVGGSR